MVDMLVSGTEEKLKKKKGFLKKKIILLWRTAIIHSTNVCAVVALLSDHSLINTIKFLEGRFPIFILNLRCHEPRH